MAKVQRNFMMPICYKKDTLNLYYAASTYVNAKGMKKQ
jgi:hypothetical protein